MVNVKHETGNIQPMAGSKTTLKDVAREAGFSVMTVSHVLNGNKANHASPRSRELIFAAAKRLNYRPNLNARRLVTQKSNIIGLLIDSQAPSFYRDVMFELERLAFAAGYRLQIGLLHNNLDSFRQYVNDFRGSGVDSVICLGHAYPEFGHLVPKLLEEFEHAVFMEQPLAETRFPVVAADHYRNYRAAVGRMLEAGYQRIITPRGDYRDRAFSEARRGMIDAYSENGVPFEEDFWRVRPDDWWRSEEKADEELAGLLPLQPDALILSNDESVFWALRALRNRGIEVPEALALFSANLWGYGRAATPSFAGFDYKAPDLAERLIARLFAELNGSGEAPPSLELIASSLVWGESCPLDLKREKSKRRTPARGGSPLVKQSDAER